MNLISKAKNLVAASLNRHLAGRGRMLVSFARLESPVDTAGLSLIAAIKSETQMLLKDQEAFLIYAMTKKTEKIPGDMAEVGVFKGASAKLIRLASSPEKSLHLFDTFEGLPEAGSEDKIGKFSKGELFASLEGVQSYLKGLSGVFFYKGLFPSTSAPVADRRFSFVHLDVDLYESTRDCLTFFYPRLSPGSIILSHNYQDLIGVRRAFDEFFKNKPEIILEPIGTSQAMIIKIGV